MKRCIFWALFGIMALSIYAQDMAEREFRSPFDFPLLLSANFGELRPNHFHNGLDIKTQGVTGKPVHSVAEGYVSRVMVLHGGYGQALFVTHPNGYTSVYGHVSSFASRIQEYVRAYQYGHETFVCDIRVEPGVLPVEAGEVIALSGNEGSSSGPHLHLELRRNDNGDYVDPMPFFACYLKDTKAPVANLVALYPVKGRGVVDGGVSRRILETGALHQGFTAWGEVYAGISAKDYMDGTSNFYGVHSVTLYVDSVQVFRSVTDKVSVNENRMINSFIDYDEYARNRRLLMRAYRAEGNTLRLLETGAGRGIVWIDEERDYSFRYVLEDNFGNVRTYHFTVRGKKQDVPACDSKSGKMLYYNRTNVIQEPGMELLVPCGMVYENTEIRTSVTGDSGSISFDYVLDAGNTPLHGFCPLSIGVRRLPVADTTKYYIEQRVGKWKTSVGGKYANGWMKTDVRTLGSFSVQVDTVPPRVVPEGRASWRNSRRIRFQVSDQQTGIEKYKVYIDGQFVLFGLKKGILEIQDPERIKKGVPHRMEVVVVDGCGNETRKEYEF